MKKYLINQEQVSTRPAWRGGTALHKLYLSSVPRYSEDIDLVQIDAEPIGDIFDALRRVLDPWLGEPRRVFKFKSIGSLVSQLLEQDYGS